MGPVYSIFVDFAYEAVALWHYTNVLLLFDTTRYCCARETLDFHAKQTKGALHQRRS